MSHIKDYTGSSLFLPYEFPLLQKTELTFAKVGRFTCVLCDCVPPCFPVPRFLKDPPRVALMILCFCLKYICTGQSRKYKGCQESKENNSYYWSRAYKVGSVK